LQRAVVEGRAAKAVGTGEAQREDTIVDIDDAGADAVGGAHRDGTGFDDRSAGINIRVGQTDVARAILGQPAVAAADVGADG